MTAGPMAAGSDWDRLWTPYRLSYVSGEGKPEHAGQGDHCPFCRAPDQTGEDDLVVARGQLVYAVLNKYPYNPGHLLICPYRHIAEFTELCDDETAEFARFTTIALRTLRECSNPGGFNIGINQGAIAGAGITAHLHQHVVPRWLGDTNFMTVVGNTRVLPQLLNQTRDILTAAWKGSEC